MGSNSIYEHPRLQSEGHLRHRLRRDAHAKHLLDTHLVMMIGVSLPGPLVVDFKQHVPDPFHPRYDISRNNVD